MFSIFKIFKKKKIVPHVRLSGIIGSVGKFKQGLDFVGQQEIIKKALMELGLVKLNEANELLVEAEKRAYADRAEYLGDNDYVSVPVEKLISKEYAKFNITSNVINLGYFDSPLWEKIPEHKRNDLINQIPVDSVSSIMSSDSN